MHLNFQKVCNFLLQFRKYKDYYYVMAFVNWSKAPVILSMHQTEEEAQEQIKLLAIELNNK